MSVSTGVSLSVAGHSSPKLVVDLCADGSLLKSPAVDVRQYFFPNDGAPSFHTCCWHMKFC